MRLALFKNGQWHVDGREGGFEVRLRNLYPNPSFESSEIPSGALRSEEWAAKGRYSLLVVADALYPSHATHPSVSLYPRKKA